VSPAMGLAPSGPPHGRSRGVTAHLWGSFVVLGGDEWERRGGGKGPKRGRGAAKTRGVEEEEKRGDLEKDPDGSSCGGATTRGLEARCGVRRKVSMGSNTRRRAGRRVGDGHTSGGSWKTVVS